MTKEEKKKKLETLKDFSGEIACMVDDLPEADTLWEKWTDFLDEIEEALN